MTTVVEDQLEEFIEGFKTAHLLLSQTETNHKSDETYGSFKIGEWRCQQDASIEQVTYYSPNPNQTLREIKYEGWRRHIATRREEEGPRFIFHMRPSSNPLRVQADLARLIDNSLFREMGCWLEPLWLDPKNPILAVNFCEDSIEYNSEYIDELFNRISSKVEQIPDEIIMSLKRIIAHSCVERFKAKVTHEGFTEGFQKAIHLLRPCSLRGVSSPFYVAAMFCQEHDQIAAARTLIKYIHKMHWQYEEAREFERSIYDKQIDELLRKIEYLAREKIKLQEKLFKMESAVYLGPEKVKPKEQPLEMGPQEENVLANNKVTLGIRQKTHETTHHHQFNCQPIIFSKVWEVKQQKLFEMSIRNMALKPKATF